ncbi:hypothetical protein A9P82_14075 [Arachidicoccus ginsenosidimutans]|uniref:vWA domain-containing protein n=1 Tax=Arachidicoccus sp. BS20 TaxID=1850526 RepID=UPI0007F16DAE|nr:VWA domain-containing protein [Arachidicoccus sp. BS20]ANI90321.1 hypothetical protein A9P82_14075 [Arachidicoccus sp. BS20]
MKNLIAFITVAFLCFSFLPQKKIIKGKVTDQNGMPLSGVSVISLSQNHRAVTDSNGSYQIMISETDEYLTFSFIGYKNQTIKIGKQKTINVTLSMDNAALNDIVVIGYGTQKKEMLTGGIAVNSSSQNIMIRGRSSLPNAYSYYVSRDEESYAHTDENSFKYANLAPLSTFSIDVDNASYSNVRRFINDGNLPPQDAVRVEEMINYFKYDYPQPAGKNPVNIVTQVSNAPWNPKHKLVQVALQAKTIPTENLPPSNFVFLIDVSGSMNEPNKLPLLVASLKMFTDNLRPKDKVAIVTYAGNASVALTSTSAENKKQIKDALDGLSAFGSTNGAGGIEKAYQIASENFIKNGNNRIILATDGDFNVGMSSDNDMQKLIEQKRQSGIYLTVLGFGMGNYKDSKMETLADKGNGNYAYIDNMQEVRRVLLNEFGGTMFTVAKDVKLQVEFNPAKVQGYRLLGYEDRKLNDEDFNDDKKDAGEMGSGQTVTAFYEIIPAGIKDTLLKNMDELKYQKNDKTKNLGNELLTVKLRYKNPRENSSKLISAIVDDKIIDINHESNDFRFAVAVAEFGMLLKHSAYKQNSNYDNVIALAKSSKGNDNEGYRAEFVRLAQTAKDLKGNEATE